MHDLKEPPENPHDLQNEFSKTNVGYKNPRKSALAQVLALLIQNWMLFIISFEMMIPRVIINALLRNSADSLRMDDDQASWFGSLLFFCHPIGCLISGLLQERFGRRGSTALINIPIFASFLFLYYANSIPILYAVSALWGLTIGLAEAPMHAYIGEIGEPHMRGTLSTLTTVEGAMGSMCFFILAYMFHWRTLALIGGALPVIGFYFMTQIPETPTWLILQNRLEDAKKSLCWLRGWVQPEEVETEFKDLVIYVRNSAGLSGSPNKSITSNGGVTEDLYGRICSYFKTQLKELTDKKVLRPLRLVCIVFVFSSIACVFGINPYLITVLNDLRSPIDSTLIMTIFFVLWLLGAIANIVFLRRFGKRKLALLAYVLAAACIFGIGAYISFLKDSVLQYPQLAWTPIILFGIHNLLQGFSLSGLAWQLVCEVYPISVRGIATGMSASWIYLVRFAMTKSFLGLQALIDLSGVMYLYGAGTLLGILYIYFYLPETEGKTLAQIESYFTDNHDRKEKFSVGKQRKYVHSC